MNKSERKKIEKNLCRACWENPELMLPEMLIKKEAAREGEREDFLMYSRLVSESNIALSTAMIAKNLGIAKVDK